MQAELHERARLLLDRSMAEGLSPEEQRWLSSHTSECDECNRYAELSRRAVRALDSFAFDLDPGAALRVQEAVRSRADRMAAQNRDIAIGIPVAVVLTILGSLAVWQSVSWLATRWNWPAPAWHMGFALLWLLPSVLVDVLLVFRTKFIGERKFIGGGETV